MKHITPNSFLRLGIFWRLLPLGGAPRPIYQRGRGGATAIREGGISVSVRVAGGFISGSVVLWILYGTILLFLTFRDTMEVGRLWILRGTIYSLQEHRKR